MEMWVYGTYSIFRLFLSLIWEQCCDSSAPRLVTFTIEWGLKESPKAVLLLQAGKFNMIPTLINMVAAFTSVGVVSFPVTTSKTTARPLPPPPPPPHVCYMYVGYSPVWHHTAELPERGRAVQGQEIWGGKGSGCLVSIMTLIKMGFMSRSGCGTATVTTTLYDSL